MDNQIYRIEAVGTENKYSLEFFICDTNELNPYRKIKELAIVVYNKETQIDSSLDLSELDSLIDYLQDAKRHI